MTTCAFEPGVERHCAEYFMADELETEQLEIRNTQPRDGVTPFEYRRSNIDRALSSRLRNSLAPFGGVSLVDEHNVLLLVKGRTHLAEAIPACCEKSARTMWWTGCLPRPLNPTVGSWVGSAPSRQRPKAAVPGRLACDQTWG